MYSCRDIYKKLGYVKWANFKHNVEKAMQIINNGESNGVIKISSKNIEIGSGATRTVIDYLVDDEALELIKYVSYNKITNKKTLRNETIILGLLEKYCKFREIEFEFQYIIGEFRFDALVDGFILVEFDEQHHNEARQKLIDNNKNKFAKCNGFEIVRFRIENDIIDVISKIEKTRQYGPGRRNRNET